MPAEEHLAARSAMEEDDGGMLVAVVGGGRQEELAVDLQAVGGGEDDLLAGRRVWRRGSPRGSSAGPRPASSPPQETMAGRSGRRAIGAKDGDGAVGEEHGDDFEAIAVGQFARRTAVSGHLPEVAAVDVVLIRGVDERAAIFAEGNVIHLKVAGSEVGGGAAVRRQRSKG